MNIDLLSKTIARILVSSATGVAGVDIANLIIDLKKSENSIDTKIDESLESLKNASKLVSELEKSLEERMNKLNTLRQEVDRYSKLAEVEEDKAKAVVQQLELSLDKRKRVYGSKQVMINL